MASFCKRGVELLKEIVNHDPDTLSPYNEELVRLVFSETDEHFKHAQTIIRESAARQPNEGEEQQDEEAGPSGEFRNPADAVALVVHYESMSRNKKLLLSYMLQRLDRLKHVRWQHRGLPTHVSEACSPQEVEFYRSYDKLLTNYMAKAPQGIGHDLTLDVRPPRDNLIQVRVVKDGGSHLFSFGSMALRAGALLTLPADEAEPLITSGVLVAHDRSEFV